MHTLIKISTGVVIAIALFIASPGTVRADEGTVTGTPPPSTVTGTGATSGSGTSCGQMICNPLKVDSIKKLLDIVLEAMIQIGTVILTLALIWTGFLFIAARGNPEKIATARSALIWTVVGGLILLGARAIKEVIYSTVNSL